MIPRLGVHGITLLSIHLSLTAIPAGAQAPNVIDKKGSALALGGPGAVPGTETPPFRSSKLPLSWMMIADTSLGVVPDELAGAQPDIKSGLYALKLEVTVRALRDVVGVELSFVTFNIWNRFTGVFRAGRVIDVKARQTRKLKLFWYGMDHDDLNVYQTSILYISRVRLADGSVIVADRSLVLAMARRIEANFTDQDLDKTKVTDRDSAETET